MMKQKPNQTKKKLITCKLQLSISFSIVVFFLNAKKNQARNGKAINEVTKSFEDSPKRYFSIKIWTNSPNSKPVM
jgi:hypothetical protein